MKLGRTVFTHRPMKKNLRAQARDFFEKHPMAVDHMAQYGFPGHGPNAAQAFHHGGHHFHYGHRPSAAQAHHGYHAR